LSNVPGSVSFTEGQSFTLAGSALVTDPDNIDVANATVAIVGGTFAGDGDVLAVNGISNGLFVLGGDTITVAYHGASRVLTLTGSATKAAYQAALDSLTFASGDNPDDFGSNPTRTVTWLLDDGSAERNLSTVQTETISITPVNDPPTLAGTANAAFTENGAAV